MLNRVFVKSMKDILPLNDHLTVVLARQIHRLVKVRIVVQSHLFFHGVWRHVSKINCVFICTLLLN